ncbi:MAG: alanine racemase [Ilumatobacteraceae bacterium]
MVRLTVQRAAWLQHVHATADAYGPALVPVVKGNGYGVGRPVLHDLVAAGLGTGSVAGQPTGDARRWVCVGSVSELVDVPVGLDPLVLTPALAPPPPASDDRPDPVLTVGSVHHVEALRGWRGRVMVKLLSSMHRFGASTDELEPLLRAVGLAGLDVVGFALHLPLSGDDRSRLDEAAQWCRWLDALPAPLGHRELWLSHLSPAAVTALAARHDDRTVRVRVGTALWHGVPRGDFVRLGAAVLQTRRVRAGDSLGYRDAVAPCDGTVVVIGAGSSHGVHPLDHADPSRRSPFHFARRRLHLVERPHMHVSLCVVPDGEPCPTVGDVVDVQQPLIDVRCDEIDWQP